MPAEHWRENGLSVGCFCSNCGEVTNLWATGHHACKPDPDKVALLYRLNSDAKFRKEYYANRNSTKESNTMFKVGQIVKTRRGQRARIVATDMRNKYPILALVERTDEPNQECIVTCTENGLLCPDGIERDNDLMPPTKTVWLNLYEEGPGDVYYDTEKQALAYRPRLRRNYVRTISIEIPE